MDVCNQSVHKLLKMQRYNSQMLCWGSFPELGGDRLAVSVAKTSCQKKLPICRLCITASKSLFNHHTYKTTHRWHNIDAQFEVLSIQHLLPSIIVFIMIWTYWLSFWQIESQPCGKAERSNIQALIALTGLIFIYLAKRFIAPGQHLFINRYPQASAHHSSIIYL